MICAKQSRFCFWEAEIKGAPQRGSPEQGPSKSLFNAIL